MFLAFREEVEDALASALSSLSLPTDDLGVEEPPEGVDAVLASSVAFRLAGEVGAPPPEVAATVADAIEPDDYEYVAAVSAQGPYVNFTPDDAYYADTLDTARNADYGRLDRDRGSIVVEHTSANPSGPLHVGRARNTIVGDALCRVLAFAGHDVERHYYVNDAGRQMALFAWAYDHFDEADLPEPEREKLDYDLVRYYRAGNAFLEEGPEDEVADAEAEIGELIRAMDRGDEAAIERVWGVVGHVLEGMRQTMNRLGVEFDEYVRETRFMRDGSTQQVVERLKAAEEAVLEDGAWQLELDDWGIDKNFVFLRSDGTTLYTTRDLAHHEWKLDNFDRALTVLGESQRLHAEQLHAALEILGNDTERLEELFYGWVNLPGGEGMSTRKGTGVDMDDLLDEAIVRAREEVEKRLDTRIRDDDLGEADVERIARQVGIGAVRYDIVSKQPTKGITFRWEEALDFEAQSAPYVQYVHARCCGILDDAEEPAEWDAGHLTAPEEVALLRQVARFPSVIEEAAEDLAPHVVATYTRDLAEAFNAFYRECPVLDAEPGVREARLALVAASRNAVANALGALGVEAPESM